MNKFKKILTPVAIILIIILGISTAVLGFTTAKLASENRETDINFDHEYPLVTNEETAMKIAEAIGGEVVTSKEFNVTDIGDYWYINTVVPELDGGPSMHIRKVDGAVVFYAYGRRVWDDCHFSERDFRHADNEFREYRNKQKTTKENN